MREPSERAMDPVSSAADGHGHRWGAVVEPVVAEALPGHRGAECPHRAGARRDIGGPLPPEHGAGRRPWGGAVSRRRLLSGAVAAAAVAALPVAAPAGTVRADGRMRKVVLIGLDGLMYKKIQQVQAPNLLQLSAEGSLSRTSIAPHITISGPSWATVLTGVWDRKHGIRNNQFDATPFATYPTVFTQLGRADPALKTHSIATWDQIAIMAASGNPRADVVISTQPVPNDADESTVDVATADAVVTAITRFGPDFLFTHLDQVDRAGHSHGGASQEYLNAVTRIDVLVGRIAAAVDARMRANPAESWTILVTADHGHLPEGGHGGQSADETTNFVIARGPDFSAGATNARYSLVDITPTVLDLLGAPPDPGSDGHSMLAHPRGDVGIVEVVAPQGVR
ncbi:alkaline phosphatase family protein [Nocardia sp. CWNU-33]|uniref:alkaline phosphatase family protein n=1 Tax=Nocardia sp. CWNU-33 TaxID=3392117 RepID=UPI00398F21CC